MRISTARVTLATLTLLALAGCQSSTSSPGASSSAALAAKYFGLVVEQEDHYAGKQSDDRPAGSAESDAAGDRGQPRHSRDKPRHSHNKLCRRAGDGRSGSLCSVSLRLGVSLRRGWRDC